MSTTTAPAPATSTLRAGDVICVTGDHDDYYGRVGTLLRQSDKGKWAVRVLDGPVLLLAPEDFEDAATFWEREGRQPTQFAR